MLHRHPEIISYIYILFIYSMLRISYKHMNNLHCSAFSILSFTESRLDQRSTHQSRSFFEYYFLILFWFASLCLIYFKNDSSCNCQPQARQIRYSLVEVCRTLCHNFAICEISFLPFRGSICFFPDLQICV